jgi:hypothetical protein
MSNLTVQTWRGWSGNNDSPDDSYVQAAIDSAEEAINDHCQRRFVVAPGSDAAARLYVPDGSRVLRIHDYTVVTSVTFDGTLLAATTYQLEPVNGLDATGLAVPYEQIRRIDGGAWTCENGEATVSIVGRPGWSALPAKYTEATKILTSDICSQRDIKNGVVGFAEYGAMRVRENPMVALLLKNLRRVEHWGIG